MTNYTFCVFTPTYNRASTLGRVYNSLCRQTYKDFWWLIIDDGSVDNTKEFVTQWIADDLITIKYVYKENGGKHTTFLKAKPLFHGKYFVVIDSDDELTDNALEIFIDTWNKISNEGKYKEIALIKAQTTLFPTLVDKKKLINDRDSIDMFYQDYSIKYGRTEECITSIRMSELSKCFDIPEKIWCGDKIKYFAENVCWARAGRHFKTRYISNVLRVRYDNTSSLTRNTSKKGYNHLYGHLVGIKYFYSENFDYLWKYRKLQTIKSIVLYSMMGLLLHIPLSELIKKLEIKELQNLMKILLVISYPAYIVYFLLNKLMSK
jgi:glycosyltransferase involved in cell wall biosynthesis